MRSNSPIHQLCHLPPPIRQRQQLLRWTVLAETSRPWSSRSCTASQTAHSTSSSWRVALSVVSSAFLWLRRKRFSTLMAGRLLISWMRGGKTWARRLSQRIAPQILPMSTRGALSGRAADPWLSRWRSPQASLSRRSIAKLPWSTLTRVSPSFCSSRFITRRMFEGPIYIETCWDFSSCPMASEIWSLY